MKTSLIAVFSVLSRIVSVAVFRENICRSPASLAEQDKTSVKTSHISVFSLPSRMVPVAVFRENISYSSTSARRV